MLSGNFQYLALTLPPRWWQNKSVCTQKLSVNFSGETANGLVLCTTNDIDPSQFHNQQ
jgi:hypothetical protein